jgi:hypothetical protein
MYLSFVLNNRTSANSILLVHVHNLVGIQSAGLLLLVQVAQGEYVAPDSLEEVYSKSNYIAQVLSIKTQWHELIVFGLFLVLTSATLHLIPTTLLQLLR